jgi:hypothetical protein
LMQGVDQGYLVQAHVEPGLVKCGCGECMLNALAAFLIGAGEDCYFGTGAWIASGLQDVENRWCPELFERPLGVPLANATKDEATGRYTRSFKSGTHVTFDTKTNKGTIVFPGDPTPPPSPAPVPTPPPAPGSCDSLLKDTGISGMDVTPGFTPGHPSPLRSDNYTACCNYCWAQANCTEWTWYTTTANKGKPGECHLHNGGKHITGHKGRLSGVIGNGR